VSLQPPGVAYHQIDVSIFDPRTAKMLTTICLFVAIGVFLYGVRHTLVIILFAVFFAYLLEPLVMRIQTSPLARGSRVLAIVETYVAIGALLVVLGFTFGPRLADDSRQLTQSLPGLIDKVTTGKIIWQFGNAHGWSYDTQLKIEQLIVAHRTELLSWSAQVGTAVAKSLQNIVWLVLIPILAIFFLRDGKRFAEGIIKAFERRDQRRFMRGLVDDLNEMLAHFILSQLILAGISLVVYSIFLSVMRFPYALVLALAAGIMEFIPVVGPLVAAAAILGVGFLAGYPHLWVMVLFFGAWRVTQDYVVAPRVMGSKLQLHPLAAIIAVLMGGELGGVLGVYLSIPLAATIRILWRRYQNYSPASNPLPTTWENDVVHSRQPTT
jgi:predicted PurR-regulated permease PerM